MQDQRQGVSVTCSVYCWILQRLLPCSAWQCCLLIFECGSTLLVVWYNISSSLLLHLSVFPLCFVLELVLIVLDLELLPGVA